MPQPLTRFAPLPLVLAALVLGIPSAAARPAVKSARPATPPPSEASQLLGEALLSEVIWERLVYLSDRIGHRLSGSAALERAVVWAQAELLRDSLWGVRAEPVLVPVWRRGPASLRLVAPELRSMNVLALGGSVSTPAEGITADVLVVDGLPDLAQRADAEVVGRIVLFDVPFSTYGETVKNRTEGPTAASRRGAVAALVRSITPQSLSTPHTGNQSWGDGATPIPAAAVTVEDASLLRRLSERGAVSRVHLELEATSEGMATSANVMGEVQGRQWPEEIVLVGCHLDSWDVGQGAQDDGAGCVMAMEVGRLIARLPRAPRRTVRVVLYTNEENGLAGAQAYAEAHAHERHVAVVEADTGAGAAWGFRVDVRRPTADGASESDSGATAAVIASLSGVAHLLENLDSHRFVPGYAGADVTPLVQAGAVGFGLDQDLSGYWPIHHTEADTIDKIDPVVLRRDAAALALLVHSLAEREAPVRPPAAR